MKPAMRRLFLPLLIAAFWLASLAGAGWMRVECVRACSQAAMVEVAVPACCAKHQGPKEKAAADCCTTSKCHKCQALNKALLALTPMAGSPLFFDTVCARVQPVLMRSSAPLWAPSRMWQWSLPPPDTLFELHCQLLI